MDDLKKIKKKEYNDHRVIGKQLDLYHIQEDAPGFVFWHQSGWTIFKELEEFIRCQLKLYNYQEIKTPLMINRILWEKTGHWEHYSENIFTTSSEHREYCIKPMNCPGHVQIFKNKIQSYRDLPLRIAEFGHCQRNEPSGSLYGLMRTREFTQDDGHIFCTENQIFDEINNCIKMMYDIYNTFKFKKILVNLSTRPNNRIGNDAIWDLAEQNLIYVLNKNNILFQYKPGEGAFYGPKIEFTLLDYLNRSWQCGTVQLDFSLPERLDVFYIDSNNVKSIPVMIHRAVLGSIERFIGILTEEYGGYYPTWLAPIQVIVINITDKQSVYVAKLTEKFSSIGIRVKADLRNEKIGFKIRQNILRKVPYILICGEREMKEGTVTIRTCRSKNLISINYEKFMEKIKLEIYNREIPNIEEE